MSLDSHPLAAFFPENVAKNPQNFIGPNIAGAIVQAIELGILVNQSAWFWTRAERENFWVKFTVVTASVIGIVQTVLSFYGTWRLMVYHFGDYMSVVILHWSETVQPVLNALVAAPVQAFLIWRCWNASGRRWYVGVTLVALLIGCIVSAAAIVVDIYNLDIASLLLHPPTHLPYAYVLSFVLTVVLDIAITGIMLHFLLSAKANVISKRADLVVTKLMRSMWEAAIPPSVCAIIAMSIYVTMSQKNFWDLFMQNILGKLYLISLFVILNGRSELRDIHSQGTHVSHATMPVLRSGNVQNAGGGQIRVHIQTVVDTDVNARAGDECYELTHKTRISEPDVDFDSDSTSPLERHVAWSSNPGKMESGFAADAMGEGRTQPISFPANLRQTSSAGTAVQNEEEIRVKGSDEEIRPVPRTWTENGRYCRETDLKKDRESLRTGGNANIRSRTPPPSQVLTIPASN